MPGTHEGCRKPDEHEHVNAIAAGLLPRDIPAPKINQDHSKKIVVGVNDFGGAYPGVVATDGAIAA